jgi:glycosyltransferase involved in cell wall biosynthesis
MGYIENCLPKALAQLGEDVHVVTTNLQANYLLGPRYRVIYEQYLGPVKVPCGREKLGNVTLHRLPHSKPLGYARPRGLGLSRLLVSLRPDIVQAGAAASWIPLEAALLRPYVGYKLFTAAHVHASVIPTELKGANRWTWRRLKSDVRRAIPGKIVSTASQKCYAITTDCAEVAVQYFGVSQRKIDVCPLGVDTDLFHPAIDAASIEKRVWLRQALGIKGSDILCIYTGRLEQEKNPLALARAVEHLRRRGQPYRALFVGTGFQYSMIKECDGCLTHSFVPWAELPMFYRAADIGVWPRQESLSMLDAAASGLPLLLSDRVKARERIEGNGLTFREDDDGDLAAALLTLKDEGVRRAMGKRGAEKMRCNFSWTTIAQRRLRDYKAAVGNWKR